MKYQSEGLSSTSSMINTGAMKDGVHMVRSELFEQIFAVVVPTYGKFIAKKKFICDARPKAKIRVSFLGESFARWFLSGMGKIEETVRHEQILQCAKLSRYSVDTEIISELGGEAGVECNLSEMFFLIEQQKKGEEGILLMNGSVNIFYIRDQNGQLRMVSVDWDGDGWGFDAGPIASTNGWHAGNQVFFRT